MTDPRIELTLAQMIENDMLMPDDVAAWHARAMKLAIAYVFRNSSGTFTCDDCGEAGTVPSTIVHSENCEVGKWLALLGGLK